MIKSRITILDGFRALAIIAVMLFHFFSRWTTPINPVSLYPYNNSYNYFARGNIGVQFFFIISGFVIFFTLENTMSFAIFWKKRFMRLFPAMVFASIITYAVFHFCDKALIFPESHDIINFIPSLLFIKPNLLNVFVPFSTIKFHYINGSYWSLWPEIQFYLLCSSLYYFKKQKFLKNFLLISMVLCSVNFVVNIFVDTPILHGILNKHFLTGYSTLFENIFNLIIYLPFFCVGALMYLLFKNKQEKVPTSAFVKICLAFFIFYSIAAGIDLTYKLLYGCMFLLFFCFIYYPKKLVFFENKSVTSIGESSYFLYLIHENIGVLLIYSFGGYFSPFGFIFPIFVIGLLILVSKFFTTYVDKSVHTWLNTIMFKKKNIRTHLNPLQKTG